jgi:hypothetical protein
VRVKFVVLAIIVAVGFAGAAQATPIIPFNTRPVPVGAPWPGEASLQSVLDASLPGANAVTGQSAAAMWMPAPGGRASAPSLEFEATSGAGTQIVGLWFGSDDANLYLVDMFLGSATAGTTALLEFVAPNSVRLSSAVGGVNEGTFTDARISGFHFGVYLRTGNSIFYSADSANGGTARVLAFEQPGFPSTWAMAFEDGGDFDYQDAVVRIESISAAVPEPGSMLLLGSGLVALLARRRRQS